MYFSSFSQVAKASFQRNNDPLDAAIYYLALKKKAVVWGLYRLAELTGFYTFPLYKLSSVRLLKTSDFDSV